MNDEIIERKQNELYGHNHDLVQEYLHITNDHGKIYSVCRNHNPVLSRVTQRMALVEQKLSHLVFSEVRVVQSSIYSASSLK